MPNVGGWAESAMLTGHASRMDEDLNKSGLEAKDIHARPISRSEIAGIQLHALLGSRVTEDLGYVIPYFDHMGSNTAFYRVRLFDGPIKYRQPPGTPNFIYYPPGFADTVRTQLRTGSSRGYIIITEGEKKAASAIKAGFPAVAVSGVDSWRTRTLKLPPQTEVNTYTNARSEKEYRVKLSSSTDVPEIIGIASGMQTLLDILIRNTLDLIIIFDSDHKFDPSRGGTSNANANANTTALKAEVQRAMADLAHYVRASGVPIRNIRHIVLPPLQGEQKTGLDDFLCSKGSIGGPQQLQTLIQECQGVRTAFPSYPNMYNRITKALDVGRIARKEMKQLAISIVADLDATGRRILANETGEAYYLDGETRKLIPVEFITSTMMPYAASQFGQYLYKRYGITAADSRVVQYIASAFTGEDPLDRSELQRVITTSDDKISLQISDGQYISVTGAVDNPIELHLNGEDSLLFEAGHVDPIDGVELQEEFYRQMADPASTRPI